ALFRVVRFRTSRGEGWRSLKDYVADLKPNQTEIYYLAGDDLARLETSPLLEGFRARGVEVLLLPDPIDSFWVTRAIGYDGKPFRSVSQGEVDLSAIPLLEEDKAEDAAPKAKVATLAALMKQTLGEAVADVRASARLATSAACLVADAHGLDKRLEKLLSAQGGPGRMRAPVLEINPRHPLVKGLADKAAGGAGVEIEDAIWLVFDLARVLDGEAPREPRRFAERVEMLLASGLA
ncbi:MAG: molecular chaperone HtpG, partial [Pseudomonadota bacterium]|nr:molecular chaperone HtpG [Pseudomonadota bacterium]